MKVIYEGWEGLRIAPKLAVDDDKASRTFGWLMVQHPDGQWVTLADLKPVAKELQS